MNDDRQTTRRRAEATEADRDVLAELVRAAGRRPVPPEDAYRRVFAASRRAWRQALRSRRRRRRHFAVAAGVAMLAVGAALVTRLVPTAPPPVIASTVVVEGQVLALAPDGDEWRAVGAVGTGWPAGVRLRTSAGGRASLDLSPGGSLRVDEATELTLMSPGRVALAAGAVYFDSGAATGGVGALEVGTSHGLVRALGTQFEVLSTSAGLRVRIREGGVEIERGRRLPRLRAEAGEQLRLDPAGGAERSPFSPLDPAWSWAVALADVPPTDGRPLMDLLHWTARETGHELRFGNPIAESRARGVILRGNLPNATPFEALEAALATTDLQHVLQEDGVLLIQLR